ncbi:MAG TPA: SDR family oxidoreductase [Candidatus Dormibacteraeota bacterium]|jgi:NAD(P)-dependent dehydrogenase (short-subunit alcohol dehydrogenase family)
MPDRGAVVITGASTGIGEATAIRLATSGFTVYAGVRKDADADKLSTPSLPNLRPIKIDVADQKSIEAAYREVEALVGDAGLAGLVNNAGISGGGPLEFTALDEIRQMFEVNVFGLIATTQAFMPLIRRATGRVVCTGSISGRTAAPFVAPYSMTKASVQSLCHALRVELRPWGIEVVCVEPGSIATPIWDKGLEEVDAKTKSMPPEAQKYYGDIIPKLKTLTERTAKMGIPPSRVADVVLQALTAKRPRARYLVGMDAKAQAALGRLPDRVRDAALSRFIGVEGKK